MLCDSRRLVIDYAGNLFKKRGYFYAGGARIANRDQYGTLQYEHAVPRKSLRREEGERPVGRRATAH
jgi:hypothetical protein